MTGRLKPARFIRAASGSILAAALLGALPARAADELAPLAGASPRTSRAAAYSDFQQDDPVGRFMDLLAGGAIDEARAMQPLVCAAWSRDRRSSPLSGSLLVNGVAISLDRLCGLPPLPPR